MGIFGCRQQGLKERLKARAKTPRQGLNWLKLFLINIFSKRHEDTMDEANDSQLGEQATNTMPMNGQSNSLGLTDSEDLMSTRIKDDDSNSSTHSHTHEQNAFREEVQQNAEMQWSTTERQFPTIALQGAAESGEDCMNVTQRQTFTYAYSHPGQASAPRDSDVAPQTSTQEFDKVPQQVVEPKQDVGMRCNATEQQSQVIIQQSAAEFGADYASAPPSQGSGGVHGGVTDSWAGSDSIMASQDGLAAGHGAQSQTASYMEMSVGSGSASSGSITEPSVVTQDGHSTELKEYINKLEGDVKERNDHINKLEEYINKLESFIRECEKEYINKLEKSKREVQNLKEKLQTEKNARVDAVQKLSDKEKREKTEAFQREKLESVRAEIQDLDNKVTQSVRIAAQEADRKARVEIGNAVNGLGQIYDEFRQSLRDLQEELYLHRFKDLAIFVQTYFLDLRYLAKLKKDYPKMSEFTKVHEMFETLGCLLETACEELGAPLVWAASGERYDSRLHDLPSDRNGGRILSKSARVKCCVAPGMKHVRNGGDETITVQRSLVEVEVIMKEGTPAYDEYS